MVSIFRPLRENIRH